MNIDLSNLGWDKTIRGIAFFLSVIFHPLFMVVYVLLITWYGFGYLILSDINLQWVIFGMVFFISFVIPSLFIILCKNLNIISSMVLGTKEDRIIPYFFTILLYSFTGLLMFQSPIFKGIISYAFFFGAGCISILFITSFWYKISAHALAVSAMVGFVLRLMFQFNDWSHFQIFLVCILVWGSVVSSRLYLQEHKPIEVYLGSVLGLVMGFFAEVWL